MTVPRFAVVTAHNRPELLSQCIESLACQVDRIIVIDNASNPPIDVTSHRDVVIMAHDPEQPPNLSRLWNRGLEMADYAAQYANVFEKFDVAVFGDDVVVPHDWWDRVSSTMRASAAVMSGTHGITPLALPLLKTEPDGDIMNRVPGWAWMLRGEVGLRLDESFKWWFGDTDLDWRARQAGGMIIAPGDIAVNQRPNEFTNARPELMHQAGLDRLTFQRKWGWAPW